MDAPPRFAFRPATLDDLPLIAGWLAQPHVAQWWGDDATFDAEDLSDPRVDVRIVCRAGQPIGYMQDYDPHGWADHPLGFLPVGARGTDQFLGPADLLGQGLGPAFIAARMSELFGCGAPAVGTDPDPRNARAIAAYRKAGFRSAGAASAGHWGPFLPMVAWAPGKAPGGAG